MLTELKVHQFAIIDSLNIHFQQGLNIISGETGAGKSVLLRALSLLMGAKASSEFIRTGAEKALIEGQFDLEKRPDIVRRLESMDIPALDGELIVRRIIGPGDKSKVYLNGSLSSVGVLRDIVAPLIEVAGRNVPLIELTGQHENKNLLSKAYHLDLLDQFAQSWSLRSHYELLWKEAEEVKHQIQELEEKSRTGNQRLDFLLFQRDEIRQFPLQPGEDQALEIKIKRLRNRQKLTAYYAAVVEGLDGDRNQAVIPVLQKILQRGHDLETVEPGLRALLGPIEQALVLVQDSSFEYHRMLETLNEGDEDVEALESQMSLWRKLQKKFGTTIEQVQHALDEMETEILSIQNSEQLIENLRRQARSLEEQLKAEGEKLHALRTKGAKKLAAQVNDHLLDLNMKGVVFDIHIDRLNQPCAHGTSQVEFVSQTSPQDPPRPLSKVASGGELSRILLSLKCVLGAADFPRTFLFDEVDTGVSGGTAEKVARKLKTISQGQQVICVTHLPQVAAQGNHHFVIQKSPSGRSVHLEAQALEGTQRVQEIARLISGEVITQSSLVHAQELLGIVKKNKVIKKRPLSKASRLS